MANVSERVKELKKNFISHRENGETIKDISNRYQVSTRHIYHILHEIADENGVSRESLLVSPHHKHPKRGSILSEQIKTDEIDEIRENFEIMLSNAYKIIKQISDILQQEEI